MSLADTYKVNRQRRLDGEWPHGDPIFVAFALTHQNMIAGSGWPSAPGTRSLTHGGSAGQARDTYRQPATPHAPQLGGRVPPTGNTSRR
jgi:hypothetical protein